MPNELLVEIMSWLPPKSLIRFKCVSKSWYFLLINLIKDPVFVAKHLQNSMSSPYILFSGDHACHCKVKTPRYCEVVFSSLNVLSDDNANDRSHVSTEDLSALPIPRYNYTGECIERYHCNGIFCLFNPYSITCTLCNPATKEFKLLPKPSHVIYNAAVGFGYDSKANNYKVVAFGYDCEMEFRAEVYCLNTHYWREIDYNLDVKFYLCANSSVYLKGVFYWFTLEGITLSFDMCNEVFQSILMPHHDYRVLSWTSLTVWNESVAVIYSSRNERVMCYEIWVMGNCYDSAKDSCSWSKVFTIEPLVEMGIPLAFRNNDELLMQKAAEVLCSYNIRSQKLTKVDTHVAKEKYYWSFSYVKSLVSVKGNE